MVQHHGWSVSDIENMYPFERDLYVEMIAEWVKKQEEAAEKAAKGHM